MTTKAAKKTTIIKKPAARKRAVRKLKESLAPVDTTLVLRTCASDMSAHGGFVWPTSGPVECPDWNSASVCGQGLHGLRWGCGNGGLLNWDETAKWLVVEVATTELVELDGKVKFQRGVVLFCGDRLGATSFIAARREGAIVGHAATAGDAGTATAGTRGTVVVRHWDGRRYRLLIGYVGEDGIESGVPYGADESGRLVRRT